MSDEPNDSRLISKDGAGEFTDNKILIGSMRNVKDAIVIDGDGDVVGNEITIGDWQNDPGAAHVAARIEELRAEVERLKDLEARDSPKLPIWERVLTDIGALAGIFSELGI